MRPRPFRHPCILEKTRQRPRCAILPLPAQDHAPYYSCTRPAQGDLCPTLMPAPTRRHPRATPVATPQPSPRKAAAPATAATCHPPLPLGPLIPYPHPMNTHSGPTQPSRLPLGAARPQPSRSDAPATSTHPRKSNQNESCLAEPSKHIRFLRILQKGNHTGGINQTRSATRPSTASQAGESGSPATPRDSRRCNPRPQGRRAATRHCRAHGPVQTIPRPPWSRRTA